VSNQSAYPLSWPSGWKRTPGYSRIWGAFDGTLDQVRTALLKEIDLLALGNLESRTRTVRNSVVISTNMPLRRDGEVNASAREPVDPGVAVYFTRNKKPVCLACDKYDRVWKNMRAIQKTIEALRGIERWGSSQLLDRAFEGFTALPERTGPSCWDILGIPPGSNEEQIVTAWRSKAKEHHPDSGGSHDAMSALNAAKDIAIATARNQS